MEELAAKDSNAFFQCYVGCRFDRRLAPTRSGRLGPRRAYSDTSKKNGPASKAEPFAFFVQNKKSLLQDLEQFQFENQNLVRSNLGRPVFAVSQRRGDADFPLVADLHLLEHFGHALD